MQPLVSQVFRLEVGETVLVSIRYRANIANVDTKYWYFLLEMSMKWILNNFVILPKLQQKYECNTHIGIDNINI